MQKISRMSVFLQQALMLAVAQEWGRKGWIERGTISSN